MKVGPYETKREIGRGGAGAVFEASSGDGRTVAVKLLLRAKPETRARFEREMRLLAALGESEGFVPLLDAGDSPNGPFIVMPFLRGGTLRQKLERGPVAVDESVALVTVIARAAGRAHERGIVHRDLKPENVLFTEAGSPLVADLGLAKHWSDDRPGASQSVSLSRSGQLRGTAGYMPREQMTDAKSAGPPADVFALGAILYECLAGKPAFAGESFVEVVASVDAGAVEPLEALRPEAPRWLRAIVARALAPAAAARFADGEELARALESGGGATVSSSLSPRKALAVVAGAVVAALALTCGAYALSRARRPEPVSPPPPPVAPREVKPVAPPTPAPAPPAPSTTPERPLLALGPREMREAIEAFLKELDKGLFPLSADGSLPTVACGEHSVQNLGDSPFDARVFGDMVSERLAALGKVRLVPWPAGPADATPPEAEYRLIARIMQRNREATAESNEYSIYLVLYHTNTKATLAASSSEFRLSRRR